LRFTIKQKFILFKKSFFFLFYLDLYYQV
jgi:hypothetical protein